MALMNQLKSLVDQIDANGCGPCGGPCSLLTKLKCLVNQIDDGSCGPCGPCGPKSCGPCGPCPLGCPPCPYPYAQVTMLTPPSCIVPTEPRYVKPLRLPCCCPKKRRDPEEDIRLKISHFYNNYNVDYHEASNKKKTSSGSKPCKNRDGVTVDGKSPCCEQYLKRNGGNCPKDEGCPTGFKPCSMRLCAPPCCDPLGVWQAQIQPCPPKCKKVSSKYIPRPCTRPCCLHWKSKDGPCLYDQPCKAHCYDHPVGIKPSH